MYNGPVGENGGDLWDPGMKFFRLHQLLKRVRPDDATVRHMNPSGFLMDNIQDSKIQTHLRALTFYQMTHDSFKSPIIPLNCEVSDMGTK